MEQLDSVSLTGREKEMAQNKPGFKKKKKANKPPSTSSHQHASILFDLAGANWWKPEEVLVMTKKIEWRQAY